MKQYRVLYVGAGQMYASMRGWDDIIDPPYVVGTYESIEEAEIVLAERQCMADGTGVHPFIKPKTRLEEFEVCV